MTRTVEDLRRTLDDPPTNIHGHQERIGQIASSWRDAKAAADQIEPAQTYVAAGSDWELDSVGGYATPTGR